MSDSESNSSEHELSFYAKDKVKLMKEVLKIIKPKKIKAMAPDCIKHMDIVDINSMLLEELLGISNKRLQYIFKGENADRETSSSESDDEEKEAIDVISLDDISDDDDDFDLCLASTSQNDSSKGRIGKFRKLDINQQQRKPINKNEIKTTIKKEKKTRKLDLKKGIQNKNETEEDRLMNVLELLELQARARAIRSQLAIENEHNKNAAAESTKEVKKENDSDSDAIIIDSPQRNEIVITSESEGEGNCKLSKVKSEGLNESSTKKQKIDVSTKHLRITNDLSEAELNLRKAKLLSKLQKIKLVRNKTRSNKSGATANENIQVNITSKAESQDESNAENVSNQTDNLSKDDSKTEIVKATPKTEDSTAGEAASTSLKQNINFCDNDEIVINLDEDEMDDIE
ncbi:hypothetical protein RN001_004998 [Aquatica leii]|uniref:Uncharacterized protein n=1 Tax=Aquatica leii TaxID=1421715 RepID=A0AAN7PC20_9COLE|nr:hypothetical protein RN001_004998 [Aquatica leii]